jgi:hypothetical protein
VSLETNWLRFRNGVFTLEPPFEMPDDPNGSDGWQKMIEAAGWSLRNHVSQNSRDMQPIEITTYERRAEEGESFEYFIDVWNDYCGESHILCDAGADYLMLLRDWLIPLLELNRIAAQERFYERANEILFDGETGLDCAKRYRAREKRDEEAARYYRAERERKSRQAAAETATSPGGKPLPEPPK